jgi:uncharacterized OB-fold protein
VSVAFPLPDVDWAPLRPFWAAAARHQLSIPRCSACGHWNWYPPERCRACGAPELGWSAVSGRGRLFSWAVVRRAWVKPFDRIAPYVTGLVALEEDPAVRVVSFVVDAAPEALRVDMPLRAVFRPLPLPDAPSDLIVPLFAPAAAAAGSQETP